jgi:dephospho-CoA kinase
MAMKWIGLTGSIGTGKSTVARLLRDAGFEVVDADQLAHDAVKKNTPGLKAVLQEFGFNIQTKDGVLDRSAMASVVFNSKENLKRLENIVHPIVRKMADDKRRALEAKGVKAAFYDVPLLFEKNMETMFDSIVVVASKLENQFARLKADRGWSDDEIKKRLDSQLPLAGKVAAAHFTIHNDSTLDNLKKEVSELVKKLGLTP